MFRTGKTMERQGRWVEASTMFEKILEKAPRDAHSHLALARLEARREPKFRIKGPKEACEEGSTTAVNAVGVPSKAQAAFVTGTAACPESVHLWQAWAVYEESRGNFFRARELFREALTLEPYNSHVCHAYGLMEKRLGNETKATELFQRALTKNSTAALVCSLGEILIVTGEFKNARDLYARNLLRLRTEKDRIEVYLASAWLEERYFQSNKRAKELLQFALLLSPGSSLANVALARLEGRIQRRSNKNDLSGNKATAKRLANACNEIEKGNQRPSDPTDGRVFNALASLKVKSRRYTVAREVLKRGMELYPLDHAVSID
jgi:tetratricopeptide (TPR) repeat protein